MPREEEQGPVKLGFMQSIGIGLAAFAIGALVFGLFVGVLYLLFSNVG